MKVSKPPPACLAAYPKSRKKQKKAEKSRKKQKEAERREKTFKSSKKNMKASVFKKL
jgi:hypothetical protein